MEFCQFGWIRASTFLPTGKFDRESRWSPVSASMLRLTHRDEGDLLGRRGLGIKAVLQAGTGREGARVELAVERLDLVQVLDVAHIDDCPHDIGKILVC